MMTTAIVTVLCPDKTGLVSAITATLWEMGANLTDTSFSVLGGGADFSAVCELPVDLQIDDLQQALEALEILRALKYWRVPIVSRRITDRRAMLRTGSPYRVVTSPDWLPGCVRPSSNSAPIL